MKSLLSSPLRLGILGGGQLGKMLLQASHDWDLHTLVLDPDENGPAAPLCTTFVKGDFKSYEDVYAFGQEVDLLTIEIENVNTEALEELEKLGKIVHPSPAVIRLIQDKGLQKEFYREHGLPSSPFQLFENSSFLVDAIGDGRISMPFVQKLRRDGYDGRGVNLIRKKGDLSTLFDQPSVVEDLIEIEKELSVIVARNGKGEIRTFPVTEMEFNPEANLVEFLFAPANISEKIRQEAERIAVELIEAFKMQGILAIEFFLTKKGEVLINEIAPRPHNSGHHTIEGNITSQYEQHLRAILDLPLGSTRTLKPAVMVNLLGEAGHTGTAVYEGIEKVLNIEGAKIHLYGKKQTKPFRKMGHVTIIADDLEHGRKKAAEIKQILKIKT